MVRVGQVRRRKNHLYRRGLSALVQSFIHLHTHSEYSILDSSCKIPALLDCAASQRMPALALTDHGVLCGAVKFYREAKKRGIKPIIGVEIYLAPGDRRKREPVNGAKYSHLVLLATDRVGYQNLLALVSLGHTEGFYYRPRVDKELLRHYHPGLIALSGCESGEIPRLLMTNREEEAQAAAREYVDIFGKENFYIELQDHGTERGARLKERLVNLARSLDLPLVATNDIHYLSSNDRHAHEVLLNIRANKKLSDPEHMSFEGEGYHFRSTEEMLQLFSDVPEAIENTGAIAERCHIEIDFGTPMIPPFDLPENVESADQYLRTLAYAGVNKLFGTLSNAVRERLEYELQVVERMNYATYFLIVWDFVRFAHENKIPVGPGRGSAAGSLVSYCLGITRVDPLQYNLIFERFLNPDRISMPDFDIDFCVKGRDRVLEYVREKYGGEPHQPKTAQIVTFDQMAARSVVRDVGRVLGTPYTKTDQLAKLIPYGTKLKTALMKVPDLKALYENDPEAKETIDIGLRLEGLIRNSSTHAAGVVIAAEALTRHVPLLRLPDGEIVTQFDMGDVEAVGLLKFDFLGLRNLTLIDVTCSTLREYAEIEIDIDNVPLDDEKTFDLIRRGATAGIFQFESSGMTALIQRVQPDRFEDLIALLALYRPGPLESGMADDYVARRSGRKPVAYPHPSLKEVLQDTYGLPIYQDQIMLIAQKLAGFTLAEADVLRKAMGKKKKEIMAGLREKFIAGCRANGIPQDLAHQTFADMEKFSRYGFNKAHATAYAFVSYWTAYLKANYPTCFMASLLTSVQGDTDKVADYIGECQEMGIEVLPPDINESERDFTPIGQNRVRFGLAAIKHVGRGAIDAILASRKKGGFASFFDLCRCVNGEGIDREALEALIKAGTFDSFGASRRGLLRHLSDGLKTMQIARHERETGQQSFFGRSGTDIADPKILEEEFSQTELLAFEKELLGLYVSADPLDPHREMLRLYCTPLCQIESVQEGAKTTVGGRIKKIRKISTKNGNRMAFLTLDDGSGEAEITIFPEVYETSAALLQADHLVCLRMTAGKRNGELNFIADDVSPITELPTRMATTLTLMLKQEEIVPERLASLSDLMHQHPGTAPVRFRIENKGRAVEIAAGEQFLITPSPTLKRDLENLLGEDQVQLTFHERW